MQILLKFLQSVFRHYSEVCIYRVFLELPVIPEIWIPHVPTTKKIDTYEHVACLNF